MEQSIETTAKNNLSAGNAELSSSATRVAENMRRGNAIAL